MTARNPIQMSAKAWWDASEGLAVDRTTWTDRINSKVITSDPNTAGLGTVGTLPSLLFNSTYPNAKYKSDEEYFDFMKSSACTVLISGAFPNMAGNSNPFVTYFNHVENNGSGMYLRRPSDGNVSVYHFGSGADSSMARVSNTGLLQHIGYIQTPTSMSVFSQDQIDSPTSFTAGSSSRRWWLGDFPFYSQPAEMKVVDLIIFDYALTQQDLTDLEEWLEIRSFDSPQWGKTRYHMAGKDVEDPVTYRFWSNIDTPDFSASEYDGPKNGNLPLAFVHVRKTEILGQYGDPI